MTQQPYCLSIEESLESLVTPGILKIRPYQPGKPIEEVKRELGLKNVVKLASNENSLGPSSKAVEAIREFADKVHMYPDGGGYYLREALARRSVRVKRETGGP